MRRYFGPLLGLILVITPRAVVPRVTNEGPALAPRTVELEELWRVGGEESELLFGTVIEAISDNQGAVYLLDHQLCHVQVFSPEGVLLRTLSREGDGPGEVRLPRDVVMLSDGSIGIPLVGEELRGSALSAARVLGELATAGINPRVLTRSASEINLALLVPEARLQEAVRGLHTLLLDPN